MENRTFQPFLALQHQLFGNKKAVESMCKLFGISKSAYYKMKREDQLSKQVFMHMKTFKHVPVGSLCSIRNERGISANESH